MTAGVTTKTTAQVGIKTLTVSERGIDSIFYGHWQTHRVFLLAPAQAVVARYVESFKDFPPRAKAASFTVSDVMKKIQTATPDRN